MTTWGTRLCDLNTVAEQYILLEWDAFGWVPCPKGVFWKELHGCPGQNTVHTVHTFHKSVQCKRGTQSPFRLNIENLFLKADLF